MGAEQSHILRGRGRRVLRKDLLELGLLGLTSLRPRLPEHPAPPPAWVSSRGQDHRTEGQRKGGTEGEAREGVLPRRPGLTGWAEPRAAPRTGGSPVGGSGKVGVGGDGGREGGGGARGLRGKADSPQVACRGKLE